MTDLTDRTLRHWRSTSHRWGEADCLLSVADHVLAATGVDYGAPWRGTYDTEAGALEHVRRSGGAVAMVDTSGLPATDDPGRGDIVVADFNGRHVGGLCTGCGIAFRRERGVIEIERRFVTILKAWKVPHVEVCARVSHSSD